MKEIKTSVAVKDFHQAVLKNDPEGSLRQMIEELPDSVPLSPETFINSVAYGELLRDFQRFSDTIAGLIQRGKVTKTLEGNSSVYAWKGKTLFTCNQDKLIIHDPEKPSATYQLKCPNDNSEDLDIEPQAVIDLLDSAKTVLNGGVWGVWSIHNGFADLLEKVKQIQNDKQFIKLQATWQKLDPKFKEWLSIEKKLNAKLRQWLNSENIQKKLKELGVVIKVDLINSDNYKAILNELNTLKLNDDPTIKNLTAAIEELARLAKQQENYRKSEEYKNYKKALEAFEFQDKYHEHLMNAFLMMGMEQYTNSFALFYQDNPAFFEVDPQEAQKNLMAELTDYGMLFLKIALSYQQEINALEELEKRIPKDSSSSRTGL